MPRPTIKQRTSVLAWCRNVVLRVRCKISFDLIVIASIAAGSWLLMQHTFGQSQGQLIIAAKAWSDFGAHIPLIRSFSLGSNWPPEYPLFPGEPIRYHFLFYAVVGWMERLGMPLWLAFNGLSAAGMTLFLGMMYRVGKLMFRNRLAGVLAVVFAVTNSSLSAWLFAAEHNLSWWRWQDWSELWSLVSTQQQFISFGPWDGKPISAFWTLNIYTNQRHLALSIGLVWWLLWPLLVRWFKPEDELEMADKNRFRWWMLARIIVLAGMPLLHQAGTILAGGMIAQLLFFSLFNRELRTKITRWWWGAYGLGLSIAALVMVQFVPASQQPPQFALGFLANDISLSGIAEYWWWNLGLGLVVWVLSLLLPFKQRWLAIWLIPFFIISNIWRFSPDMINNHKLINFVIQGLALLAAGWLSKVWLGSIGLWSNLGKVTGMKKALAGAAIALGVSLGSVGVAAYSMSGIVDLYPILNDHRYTLDDWQTRPISQWLNEHTSPSDVLLTTTYFYHPASLVGRKMYIDYGYFAWSLGYADAIRRAQLLKFFATQITLAQWCELAEQEHIAAVVISPGNGELGDAIEIDESYVVSQLEPTVTTSDGYRVYTVANYCQ